jgi:secreted PhoX family phosphatase
MKVFEEMRELYLFDVYYSLYMYVNKSSAQVVESNFAPYNIDYIKLQLRIWCLIEHVLLCCNHEDIN